MPVALSAICVHFSTLVPACQLTDLRAVDRRIADKIEGLCQPAMAEVIDILQPAKIPPLRMNPTRSGFQPNR